MPTELSGVGYKLRVKSSSPEKFSPVSDAFEAYYITSERLILNNYTDVILCQGASKDLNLNISTASKYQWYKNGVKFYLGASKLTVTEPGLYYSEIFYGACSGVVSNIVEVTQLPNVESSIIGDATIELCPGDTHTLETTVKDRDYIYAWYKNGVRLSSFPKYAPTCTVTSDDFGTYYVEIENSQGCVGKSNDVVVQAPKSNFSVLTASKTASFIFPDETKSLKIEHNAIKASVKWYKDNVAIKNSNKNQIEITEPGIYKAKVTSNNGSCSVTQESPDFRISKIADVLSKISFDSDYTSCQSAFTKLQVQTINIAGTDNNKYVLTEDSFKYLNFQWYKNGAAIQNETNSILAINDFKENGLYSLKVSLGPLATISNEIEVKLAFSNISISTDTYFICDGNAAQLKTPKKNNFIYQWFKNGILIPNANTNSFEAIEAGSYQLEATAYNCKIKSEEIIINDFDASHISIDAPQEFTLSPEEIKTITVSGADFYEWLDTNSKVISSNAAIKISSKGVYNLAARKGNCSVFKTISVSETEVKTVPNVLTLNGDGINDIWVLSNKYAFQTNVEIQIYNTDGTLLLKTASYQNNWPSNDLITKNQLFFYIIKKENKIVKKGTISIIK